MQLRRGISSNHRTIASSFLNPRSRKFQGSRCCCQVRKSRTVFRCSPNRKSHTLWFRLSQAPELRILLHNQSIHIRIKAFLPPVTHNKYKKYLFRVNKAMIVINKPVQTVLGDLSSRKSLSLNTLYPLQSWSFPSRVVFVSCAQCCANEPFLWMRLFSGYSVYS